MAGAQAVRALILMMAFCLAFLKLSALGGIQRFDINKGIDDHRVNIDTDANSFLLDLRIII